MKILVTPRSFAIQDRAPLDLLKSHGEVVLNQTGGIMKEDDLRAAIAGCQGVIIGVDPLTASVMEAAPDLKAVAKYGVGVDNIDLDYCKAHGIAVSRTVGSNSDAVADYAFALMLALARKVPLIDRACRGGNWKKITTSDVYGKTLGILGLGAIGKGVARRAAGFQMKILGYDVFWDDAFAEHNHIQRADVDTICQCCDFISIHLPLTEETQSIIDQRRLSLMKPTAFLINTARGGLIDEKALLAALQEQKIGGAGIDTFSVEPPEDPAWVTLDNIILGSHCAASTVGASNQMSSMAAQNLLHDLGVG